MRKQNDSKITKMIGKNCKHNYEDEYKSFKKGFFNKMKKRHFCNVTRKFCGLEATCNAFRNGKLCFERKGK